MSARAGIIVTGTEVLSGRIADRNGPWVSQRLSDLGLDVAHMICVGDRAGDIDASLRFLAANDVDLIITTGGLGPTADDMTAELVAAFAGREMLLDEEMEDRIEAIVAAFAKRMKFDPEAMRAGTRKQAMVPEGSIALDPAGTAPGLVVEADGPIVVVLPGPPRELQSMWPAAVASAPFARVLERSDEYVTASMKMFGIPESTLAQSLREIEADGVDLDPLEITTCLRMGAELEIDVRYTADAEPLRAALFDGLRERHAGVIYTERGETIDVIVAGLLRGHRIATAESCTAGKLAARLTDLPGSSDYVAGGVAAYSNEAKIALLGVGAKLIEAEGAVSPQVAEALAKGAIERFDADLGVGITGIAGPGGGSEEKPVGYVCFCVAAADGRTMARDVQLPGSRGDVRERSVSIALHMLRRFLTGGDLPI